MILKIIAYILGTVCTLLLMYAGFELIFQLKSIAKMARGNGKTAFWFGAIFYGLYACCAIGVMLTAVTVIELAFGIF